MPLILVPDGISPGFDYNPGTGRQIALDSQLYSAAVANNSYAQIASEFASPYRMAIYQNWLGKVKNQFETAKDGDVKVRPRGEKISLGYVAPALTAEIVDQSTSMRSSLLIMDDNMVVGKKIIEKHDKLGNRVSDADMNNLPVLMTKPRSIYLDTEKNQLIYILDGDEKMIKVVFNLHSETMTATMFYMTENGYRSFVGLPENVKIR